MATAEGIMKTFQQASRLQENKDLERFASVVVLDEVGLAEDSPKMPLKVKQKWILVSIKNNMDIHV